MTIAELADLPTYALFASAAKHAMDDALRFERRAEYERDHREADWCRLHAERLRAAAWSHMAAARKEKRRAGA